jgi:hypothetical protein
MRKKDELYKRDEAMSFCLSRGYRVYIIPTNLGTRKAPVYKLAYEENKEEFRGGHLHTKDEAEAKIHSMYEEYYKKNMIK